MSLDNLQLTPIVLQDLYKNTLVDLQEGITPKEVITGKKYSFLGDNKKHISIIVNNEEAIYLPDEELNFLLGILTACKLSIADVALLNCCRNPSINYTGISEELLSEIILLFGVEPAILQLPLQFPHYQIQRYNDQVYLSSPALQILADDRSEKMKLWNCLKQIFSLG